MFCTVSFPPTCVCFLSYFSCDHWHIHRYGYQLSPYPDAWKSVLKSIAKMNSLHILLVFLGLGYLAQDGFFS